MTEPMTRPMTRDELLAALRRAEAERRAAFEAGVRFVHEHVWRDDGSGVVVPDGPNKWARPVEPEAIEAAYRALADTAGTK